MAWSDEKKAEAVQMYKDGNPTAANSMEIVKEVAEQLEESPNGVRMILTTAGVYIKKEAAVTASAGGAKGAAAKTTRVSKADAQAALEAALEAAGASVDSEITSKLTGKASVYFTEVLASIAK